ncbi:MAG TPA: Smr/MutS family protein [Flavobacteriales bacterium]|mgnify:CR=1 FL=1|nr:Smr/MutS family protein [Flavobacteriales bacterium]HRE98106.1 Smr/MutS family protein [Flavobacteriales bacterium]HRJ36992.1 Smr/MutS family protein [Flavobacteriales bacterium]HRJ39089.1 Smr/MutS family protein [Flavobacteriales bacterium]
MARIKIDLHPIFNDTKAIDKALRDAIREAIDCKITLIEIIPGKGSGALKEKVIRFLEKKEIKQLYHRIEKDPGNHGRLWVHFRFTNPRN